MSLLLSEQFSRKTGKCRVSDKSGASCVSEVARSAGRGQKKAYFKTRFCKIKTHTYSTLKNAVKTARFTKKCVFGEKTLAKTYIIC